MNKKDFDKIARGELVPLTDKRAADPYPSVIYQGEIIWLDGVPSLKNNLTRISSKPADALRELMTLALDLPYDGKDPSLQGLTNGEAMIISQARQAANGDATARGEIMDRIMGRPQQNIKSVHLSGDINELLDTVSRETRTMVIDADGVPRPPDTQPNTQQNNDLSDL